MGSEERALNRQLWYMFAAIGEFSSPMNALHVILSAKCYYSLQNKIQCFLGYLPCMPSSTTAFPSQLSTGRSFCLQNGRMHVEEGFGDRRGYECAVDFFTADQGMH